MKLYELFGYDRHGTVSELDTALSKGKLGTKDVSFSALGFNAPAWVAASSMSILYSISGHQALLAILIAFFFPMLVLAVCMVSLTRQAPSAGGIFTFCSRFLHPIVVGLDKAHFHDQRLQVLVMVIDMMDDHLIPLITRCLNNHSLQLIMWGVQHQR